MSRRSRLTACLAATLVLGIAHSASAQTPLPVGSAAGYGLGAMTESRLSESALWNPALAAIFDGPMSSSSLLGIVAEPGQTTVATDLLRWGPTLAHKPVTVVTPSMRAAATDWLGGRPEAAFRGTAGVQWIGLHARDLLISLTSYDYTQLRAPASALRIIAGDTAAIHAGPTADELAGESTRLSRRTLVSVLAIAKGSDLGERPLLGHVWTGFTLKASLVHTNAQGRFVFADATGLAELPGTSTLMDTTAVPAPGDYGVSYTEVGVHNLRIYGADWGTVFHPSSAMLVSVAFANLYQKSIISQNGSDLRALRVDFAGRDAAGNTRAYAHAVSLNPDDASRPWLADANAMARAAHFTPMVRVGVSLDTQLGRLLAGVAQPTDQAPSIDRDEQDRWSLGWQAIGTPLRPRVSFTKRLDGSTAIAGGFQRGFCGDRWSVGAGYVQAPAQPPTYSLSIMWSRGNAPCGLFR